MFSEVSRREKGSSSHCIISIVKTGNQKLFPATTAGAMVIPVGNFTTAFSSHYTENLLL